MKIPSGTDIAKWICTSGINSEKSSQAANLAGKLLVVPAVYFLTPSGDTLETKASLSAKQNVEGLIGFGVQYPLVLIMGHFLGKFVSNKLKGKDLQPLIKKVKEELTKKGKDITQQDINEKIKDIIVDRAGTITSFISYFPALWIINRLYPKFDKLVLSKLIKKPKTPEQVRNDTEQNMNKPSNISETSDKKAAGKEADK